MTKIEKIRIDLINDNNAFIDYYYVPRLKWLKTISLRGENKYLTTIDPKLLIRE